MAINRPRGQQPEEQPSDTPKRRGRLNNMEMLGIGFFVLAICLYGLSKCGAEDKPIIDPILTEQTLDSLGVDSVSTSTSGNSSFSHDGSTPAATPSVRTTINVAEDAKFYVIIDSLKIRKGPSLDSAQVAYLRYGEEVMNLGEQTVLEKIRISVDEVRTAPWVKVKTSKGKIGWAFGAGLQFYPVPTETNLPANN